MAGGKDFNVDDGEDAVVNVVVVDLTRDALFFDMVNLWKYLLLGDSCRSELARA